MNGLDGHLEQRLRDRGLRATRERRTILAHAFEHFGHFEAGELFGSLRRHGHSVSRATVYRTLAHLVRAGLLRRHDLGDRRTLYEPVVGREHHEHMVCVSCGRILEFVEEEIERLQESGLPTSHRFRPIHSHSHCRSTASAVISRRSDRSRTPAVEE